MRKLVLAGLMGAMAIPFAAHAHPATPPMPPSPRVGPNGHWQMMRPGGWQWGGPGWWGGSFQRPVRGFILPSFWLTPTYIISDWQGYGLAEPGGGRRWVRYYDDAVLVDDRGMIYDSVHDVAWDRAAQGPVPAYAGDAPDSLPSGGDDFAHDDDVTWQGGHAGARREIWAWPSGGTTTVQSGATVMLPPGSSTTIVVQQQPVTTTETITYYEQPRTHYPRSYQPRPAEKAAPRAKAAPRPSDDKPRVIGRVPISKS